MVVRGSDSRRSRLGILSKENEASTEEGNLGLRTSLRALFSALKSQRFLVSLLIISVALRLIWLNVPEFLVFDEYFYVNAARVILKLPQSGDLYGRIPYTNAIPGLDPSAGDHPPLAKLIIALSISIFGDNGWGWRLPSAILGSLCILFLYLSAKKLRNSSFALFVAFIFSFESLFFVHSRIATLDIYMLVFILGGLYTYIAGKPSLSAVFFALGTLSKLTAVYGLAAMIIFHLLRGNDCIKAKGLKSLLGEKGSWLIRYVFVYVGATLGLLTLFSVFWGGSVNPIEHLVQMSGRELGTSTVNLQIASYPWQWLIDQVQINYFSVNYGGHEITLLGLINPAVIAFFIPSTLYVIYRVCCGKDQMSLFATSWTLTTYLSSYLLVMLHRATYLFYFLPTVPSLCLTIGVTFFDEKVPAHLQLGLKVIYCLLVLVGFLYYFPFR